GHAATDVAAPRTPGRRGPFTSRSSRRSPSSESFPSFPVLETLVALVAFTMAPARVSRVSQLRNQVAALETALRELQSQQDTHGPGSASTYAARVPTNLPSFCGRRQDDVRQWLFHVETMCKIHAHDVCDDNAMLPAIAGLAVAEPASGWFLNWANTVPPEKQVWGRFKIDVLAHFEASNYQATLRLKLLNLRQEGDIEDINGCFADLNFRVEDMGELDRVSHYCIGLKHQTQSYVKLHNPLTLSDVMDLALKYEGAHFMKEYRPPRIGERSVRRNRPHDRPPQSQRQPNRPLPKRPDLSRCKPKPTEARRDTRKLKCFFCSKMFAYRHAFVTEAELPVDAHPSRELRVQTGDGRTVSSPLELVHVNMEVPGVPTCYATTAVVYDLPDRIDCILGMPFFEEKQPQVDWKTTPTSVTTPADPRCSRKANAAQEEVLPATSTDYLGVAVPETDKQPSAKKLDASREMACPGESDLRKKLVYEVHQAEAFAEASTPAQDFILVLTNEAIKKVKRDTAHPDESDDVASEKARRFLDTDWESFSSNPACTNLRTRLAATLRRCQEALAEAQERMRTAYNRNCADQGCPRRPSSVQMDVIGRRVHNRAYELNLRSRLHPEFNTSLLKPYFEGSRSSAPARAVLGDGLIIVRSIVGKRMRKKLPSTVIRPMAHANSRLPSHHPPNSRSSPSGPSTTALEQPQGTA
ncbi:TPA: hypothetical protein N0F65_008290, partial [Lagenidium giganteum]